MDLLLEKVRPLMIYASEQVLVGIVLAFHVTVFALLTIPESISSATSLGGLLWDQLSSPSPHAPAGDLTFRLFRIWTNHVVDVEIPRFRNLAARFDGKLALSFKSLELYMGMAAHAEMVANDLTVFAHIHPSGSVPMAALMMRVRFAPTQILAGCLASR